MQHPSFFFRTAGAFAHHGAATASQHVTLAQTFTGKGWPMAWFITIAVLAVIAYGAYRAFYAITDGLHARKARREYYATPQFTEPTSR